MTLLGDWHADPLDMEAARTLLAAAQQRRRRGTRQRRCRTCQLQEMIARYWLGEDIAMLYRDAAPLLQGSAHGRALLELVVGQLLQSRRRRGAQQHLERGFHLGSRLFTPADYLAVLNRHQQLARLPPGDAPQPAATLAQLLVTARVIERLEGRARRPHGKHDPTDLYG
jgi:hypothetical protein